MRAGSISGKRTKLVFRNNVSVLGIEFSSVTQVFVHDRCAVIDVLSAKDVGEFVDQSNDIRFRFGVRTRVTKWFVDWRNDIVAQPLLTIADAIDTGPTGDEVTAYAFRAEYYNQVIAPVLVLSRKFLLDSGQQIHCGVYPFLYRPRHGALGGEPNTELTFVIVGGCFNQSARLIRPTGVPRSEAYVCQRLDADHSLRRLGSQNGAGRKTKRTKDGANYPSARSHRSIRGRLGRVTRRRNKPR